MNVNSNGNNNNNNANNSYGVALGSSFARQSKPIKAEIGAIGEKEIITLLKILR